RESVVVEHEAGIAAGAEGGDLVVAVKLLADAVAQGVRALPEQLVEDFDVVAVQGLLVTLEGGGDLGHDLGDVDVHGTNPLNNLSSGAQRRTSSPLATGMRSFAALRMTERL